MYAIMATLCSCNLYFYSNLRNTTTRPPFWHAIRVSRFERDLTSWTEENKKEGKKHWANR